MQPLHLVSDTCTNDSRRLHSWSFLQGPVGVPVTTFVGTSNHKHVRQLFASFTSAKSGAVKDCWIFEQRTFFKFMQRNKLLTQDVWIWNRDWYKATAYFILFFSVVFIPHLSVSISVPLSAFILLWHENFNYNDTLSTDVKWQCQERNNKNTCVTPQRFVL